MNLYKINMEDTIKALFQIFYNSSWLEKQGAAKAISILCSVQSQIIDILLKELSSQDISIRLVGLIALRYVEENEGSEPRINNAFLATLSDPNWVLRREAVRAFGQSIGRKVPDINNVLLPTFSDSSSFIRQLAMGIFDLESNGDPNEINMLRQGLADSSWEVREQAARVLSYIGEEIDGIRIEQLLSQYEPLALRNLRSYSNLYQALKRIAEKV